MVEDGDGDAAPGSAADTLKMIREQQATAERSLTPDPRLICWAWGTAWLVGFGLLYLRFGPDGAVTWNIPSWLPLTTLFSLMGVSAVITGYAVSRAARQVRGDSATKGMMYGLTWMIGFIGVSVLAAHLSRFLPDPEVGLTWAAVSIGLVAVMYMAGGAIWNTWILFLLGSWIGAVNVVGVVAGAGWHSLVTSLAGGGGLIVCGFVAQVARRRD